MRTFPSLFLYIAGKFPSSVHQTRTRKGLTSYQRYLSHKYTVQSVLEDVAISFDCIQEFTPPNFILWVLRGSSGRSVTLSHLATPS